MFELPPPTGGGPSELPPDPAGGNAPLPVPAEPPPGAAFRPRWVRPALAAGASAVAVIVLLLIFVVHVGGIGASTHKLQLTISFPGATAPQYGFGSVPTCDPSAVAEGPVSAGTTVVVKDQAGTVIGTSSLDGNPQIQSGCIITYSATIQVPEVSYYQLAIGTRPAPIFSLAELRLDNWNIALHIRS